MMLLSLAEPNGKLEGKRTQKMQSTEFSFLGAKSKMQKGTERTQANRIASTEPNIHNQKQRVSPVELGWEGSEAPACLSLHS